MFSFFDSKYDFMNGKPIKILNTQSDFILLNTEQNIKYGN